MRFSTNSHAHHGKHHGGLTCASRFNALKPLLPRKKTSATVYRRPQTEPTYLIDDTVGPSVSSMKLSYVTSKP